MRERSDAGGVLAVGLALSVVCALPGIVGSWSAAGVPVLAALPAATSLTVVPVALWLRRQPRAALPVLTGAALASLPLALLGSVLKSATHHRPLGGATFAVVASVLVALGVALAFRAWAASSVKAAWQTKIFQLLSMLSLVCTAALLLPSAGSALAEVALLGGAIAIAGRSPLPLTLQNVPLALTLGLWSVLVVLGLLAVRDPNLAHSLAIEAPVAFTPLSWLGARS
jgi:hypothetical protein